jgi:ABC-2 type transport system permease protein
VVFASQVRGAVAGAPLSFVQSVLLIWPQVTGLVAGMIIVFSASYMSFQRQEVRA